MRCRVGFLFLSVLVMECGVAYGSNDPEKLNNFPLGAIVITEAHVRIAPVTAATRKSSVQSVEGLELDRGIIFIGPPEAKNENKIRAEIAPGVPGDPSARLSGTIEWQNGVPTRFKISSLHLRLIKLSGRAGLYGGTLEFQRGASLFIDSNSQFSITDGKSEGNPTLSVKAYGSRIVEPEVAIQGTSLSAVFTSEANKPSSLSLNLGSGIVSALDGRYYAASAEGSGIDNFAVSGDRLKGKTITAMGTELVIEGGSPSIQIAEAHIRNPQVQVEKHSDIPVVAALDYVIQNAHTESLKTAELKFSALQASASFVTPDPWEIANQLNEIGIFQTEALLPTGNSDVKYIRPPDLGRLYEAVANASPGKTITSIIVRQSEGVVSEIVVDVSPAPSVKDGIDTEKHPICVFIETLTGLAASKAVDALFAEVPIASATAAWLRVANPLNPKLAVPTFLTTYAVSKGTVRLFGAGFNYKGIGFDGIAAWVTGTIASNYCEAFIAKLPNRYVFRRPNYLLKPLLFETIQVSPDRLFTDELAMHYQTYLTNTVNVKQVLQDPAFRGLESAKTSNGEIRRSLSTTAQGDVKQALIVRGEQETVAKQQDDKSAQQRAITTGMSQTQSDNKRRTSDAQIAEDNRRKKAQENVTKSDPNQQVPGVPPPNQQPGAPKTNPSNSCPPGSDGCLSTRPDQKN